MLTNHDNALEQMSALSQITLMGQCASYAHRYVPQISGLYDAGRFKTPFLISVSTNKGQHVDVTQ
jgi:hypothetical protein